VAMRPRYAFRLEDLRVFHLVRASRHACGHKAIVPNTALLQGRPLTRAPRMDHTWMVRASTGCPADSDGRWSATLPTCREQMADAGFGSIPRLRPTANGRYPQSMAITTGISASRRLPYVPAKIP
jgi:hypothetical protein